MASTRRLVHLMIYLFSLIHFPSFSSQYAVFICTEDTPWLNGKHVVFGKVTAGLDIVKKIEAQGTGGNGQPKTEVKITASGEL